MENKIVQVIPPKSLGVDFQVLHQIYLPPSVTTPRLSGPACPDKVSIYYQGLMPQYFYFILNTLFFFLIFYMYPILGVCKTNVQASPEMESISGLILIITSVCFVLSGIMTSR